MSKLKQKMTDYMRIANYTIRYELDSGMVFAFKFTKQNFPHMIGLHKLIDIPLIGRFNNPHDITVSTKYLMSKIKKEELTEEKDNAFRQLCIAQDKNLNYYAETFFYEKSSDYIKGQLHEKVKRVQIIAPDSTIYLEDTF